MKGLNKVMLIGNVGSQPEIKSLQSGHTVARFSMATTEIIKKADGSKHTETQWHNIIAWNSLAQVIEKHISKGTHIHLQGKLQYRSYTSPSVHLDAEGITHYITEIVADDIILLDKKIQHDKPE